MFSHPRQSDNPALIFIGTFDTERASAPENRAEPLRIGWRPCRQPDFVKKFVGRTVTERA